MKIIKIIKKTELSKIMFLGLCTVFFIEPTFKNFHIGPASIRTVILLLLISFFIWNEIFIKKRKLLSLFEFVRDPIIKFSLLFFIWNIIAILIIHRIELDPNVTHRMLIGICIPILCISFLRSTKKIKIFIYVGISALFISSLAAVLQNHIGGLFVSLPGFLGDVDSQWYMKSINDERYTGLLDSCLTLSYAIVNVFPLLISIALFGSNRKKIINVKKIVLFLLSITIFYALILTGTRSAFFGIMIGLLFTSLLIGVKQKKILYKIAIKVFLFLFVIIIFGLIINKSQIRFVSRFKTFSYVKIPRITAGLKTSKKSLLLGKGSPIAEPLKNEKEIPVFLRKYSKGTGEGRSHNIFINKLLTGGLPMLTFLIIFLSLIAINIYFIIFKILKSGKKQAYLPYYFGYSIWLIAYILDKQVHNADPFNDLLFWYILGSMMALTRIFKKEEAATALRASQ